MTVNPTKVVFVFDIQQSNHIPGLIFVTVAHPPHQAASLLGRWKRYHSATGNIPITFI